jgi:hypothetical protein
MLEMQPVPKEYRPSPFTIGELEASLAEQQQLNENPQPLVIGNNYLITYGPYNGRGKVYKYIRFDENKLYFGDKDKVGKFERPFTIGKIYNGGVDSMEKYYIYPYRGFQGEKTTMSMSDTDKDDVKTNLGFGGRRNKRSNKRNNKCSNNKRFNKRNNKRSNKRYKK